MQPQQSLQQWIVLPGLCLLLATGGDCKLQFTSLSAVDPLALCTDGSHAAYYWEEGTPHDGEQLWLIYLQGGYQCFDRQSCKDRCGGTGSAWCGTGVWGDHFPPGEDGIMSSKNDSTLRGANKAFIRYCTSDAHMADATAFGMQFRGARVVRAVIDDLVRRGLGEKGLRHTLVFAGGSAGARGALIHLDWVHDMFGPDTAAKVRVVGLLDSPLWLDMQPLEPNTESLMDTMKSFFAYGNVSHLGECGERYNSSLRWHCIFPQYRLKYVRTEYLIIANSFDAFQLGRNAAIHSHGTAPQEKEDYALEFANKTLEMLNSLKSPQHAVYSTACLLHDLSSGNMYFTSRVGHGGPSMNGAIAEFLDHKPSNQSLDWIDRCTGFDCGTGCMYPTWPPRPTTTSTSTRPGRPYGECCSASSDCHSGLCGTACSARNSSCVCPTIAGPAIEAEASGQVCCGTVSKDDYVASTGKTCVSDDAKKSIERNAHVFVPELSSAQNGGSGGSNSNNGSSSSKDAAAAAAFEAMLAAGSKANKDAATRFGMPCSSWSECSSGLCASECRCGTDGKQSCSCSCGGLQSATGEGSAQTLLPSCCAFFVGDEACGEACPPCSQKQCHQLKPERSCHWGCTKGAAAGECSVSPDAFLLDRQQCSECCNANFCHDEAGSLRGSWIAYSSAGGWQPGLDAEGRDMWTGTVVPCPAGEHWAAEGCQTICELPAFTRVDRVLALGNSTWVYDENHASHQPLHQKQQQHQLNHNPLFVDGAVIYAVCVRGATGSKKILET